MYIVTTIWYTYFGSYTADHPKRQAVLFAPSQKGEIQLWGGETMNDTELLLILLILIVLKQK